MNVKEHLWTTMNEEAMEIMKNIFKGEPIYYELDDLIAVGEMLGIETNESKAKNEEDFINSLIDLHYSISKGLRFGFEDFHPETGIRNIDSVVENFSKIYNYVNGGTEERKSRKKEKVVKFIEYARTKKTVI